MADFKSAQLRAVDRSVGRAVRYLATGVEKSIVVYGAVPTTAAVGLLCIQTLAAVKDGFGLPLFKALLAAFMQDLSKECGVPVSVIFGEEAVVNEQ